MNGGMAVILFIWNVAMFIAIKRRCGLATTVRMYLLAYTLVASAVGGAYLLAQVSA